MRRGVRPVTEGGPSGAGSLAATLPRLLAGAGGPCARQHGYCLPEHLQLRCPTCQRCTYWFCTDRSFEREIIASNNMTSIGDSHSPEARSRLGGVTRKRSRSPPKSRLWSRQLSSRVSYASDRRNATKSSSARCSSTVSFEKDSDCAAKAKARSRTTGGTSRTAPARTASLRSGIPKKVASR